MNNRPLAGIVILTAALFAAAGVTTAMSLRPLSVPDDLEAAPMVTSAPVTEQSFTDERSVNVQLITGTPRSLTAPRAGTVTQTTCQPGAAIESGTSPLRLDDAPVLVLHTTVPLYRDLDAGAQGADVTAVQEELLRLGHDVTADGYYGWMTAQAIRDLKEKAGEEEPKGTLALAETVWLPAESFIPDTCDSVLGQTLAPGTAFATTAAVLTAVALPSLPSDLVGGERTLALFGSLTVVPAEGQPITDAEFLAAVAASEDYATWLSSPDQQTPTARITLTTAVLAYKLPPAAIFNLNGSSGCVQTGDRPLPVTIVGSGLGASLVTFGEAEAPGQVNLGPAITAANCDDEENEGGQG